MDNRTNTDVRPPPPVRFLAAAAHAGFWAGALPLHVALQTYDFDVYTRISGLLALLVLFGFTPPAVTLLAARRSAWRRWRPTRPRRLRR